MWGATGTKTSVIHSSKADTLPPLPADATATTTMQLNTPRLAAPLSFSDGAYIGHWVCTVLQTTSAVTKPWIYNSWGESERPWPPPSWLICSFPATWCKEGRIHKDLSRNMQHHVYYLFQQNTMGLSKKLLWQLSSSHHNLLHKGFKVILGTLYPGLLKGSEETG